MQGIIEEAIRGLGYLVLRAITLGWYGGVRMRERLFEGVIGLGAIALLMYVVYAARG